MVIIQHDTPPTHPEVEPVSSPFWAAAWPTESDRREATWHPRLDHKRPCSFILPNRTLVLRSFLKPPPRNSDYAEKAMLEGTQTGSILNVPSWAQPFCNPCQSASRLLPSRTAYLPARHHWVTSDGTIKRTTQPNPVHFPTHKMWDIMKWVLLKIAKFLSGLLHTETYLEKHIP